MKLALALALAFCALLRESTAAAVEGDGRHPLSRRLASEVGGGGSKRSTPPPVPSSKRKVSKKTGAVVIGVIAGAIAAVFLFILCAGCFMFYGQWKKENPRSESSPLLPEPE